MEILRYALRYIELGFWIFPVHGIIGGICTCGNPNCRDPGKHPRTLRGLHEASNDEAKIRYWFETMYPGDLCNIGIVTGPQSGFWVLDLDIGKDEDGQIIKDGNVSLHEWCEGRELPETPEALTGSGSGAHHMFFKWDDDVPIRNTTKTELGIDTRGMGGYVVGTPSNHILGGSYKWVKKKSPEDLPFAEAPKWLTDRLDAGSNTTSTQASAPIPFTPAPPDPDRPLSGGAKLPEPFVVAPKLSGHTLTQDRADEIRDALAAIDPDLGYEDWVAIAMGVHDETDGSDEGFNLFLEWSHRGSKFKGQKDCHAKWKSFKDSYTGPKRTIDTVFQKAWENTDYVEHQSAKGVSSPPLEPVVAEPAEEPVTAPAPAAQPSKVQPTPFKPKPFKIIEMDELMALRPPPSLIQGMLSQGELVMVYGEPSSGKSFVVLSMALKIASGQPWFGLQVKQGVVLYGSIEGLSGMPRRVLAAMGSDPLALQGKIKFTEDIQLNDKGKMARLDVAIKAMEVIPSLVVVDTLSRAIPGADENTAKDVTPIVEACRTIQRKYGCTIILVHHTRKAGDSERGSTVITGAADRKLRVTKTRAEGCDTPRVEVAGEKSKDDLEFKGIILDLKQVLLPELAPDDFGKILSSCRLQIIDSDAESWSRINTITSDPTRRAQIRAVIEAVDPFTEDQPITFPQLLIELAPSSISRSGLQRAVKALEKAELIMVSTTGKGGKTVIWPKNKYA